MLMYNNLTSSLASLAGSDSDELFLECPVLRSKLQKLLEAARGNREPGRVIRLSKRLCERAVKDGVKQSQHFDERSFWKLLRRIGCVYLPNGDQDRVLEAVLHQLGGSENQNQNELEQRSRPKVTRAVATDRVMAYLNNFTHQLGRENFSRTNVGHVLQLLFRGNAFLVSREEALTGGAIAAASAAASGTTLTCWQLRPELVRFDELRRVHDYAVIDLAQRNGYFLSPAAWSRCLYKNFDKTAYFQSIVDRQRLDLDGLVVMLRRISDAGDAEIQVRSPFSQHAIESLANLAAIPDTREHQPTADQVESALQAVYNILSELRSLPRSVPGSASASDVGRSRRQVLNRGPHRRNHPNANSNSNANVEAACFAPGLVSPSSSASSSTFDDQDRPYWRARMSSTSSASASTGTVTAQPTGASPTVDSRQHPAYSYMYNRAPGSALLSIVPSSAMPCSASPSAIVHTPHSYNSFGSAPTCNVSPYEFDAAAHPHPHQQQYQPHQFSPSSFVHAHSASNLHLPGQASGNSMTETQAQAQAQSLLQTIDRVCSSLATATAAVGGWQRPIRGRGTAYNSAEAAGPASAADGASTARRSLNLPFRNASSSGTPAPAPVPQAQAPLGQPAGQSNSNPNSATSLFFQPLDQRVNRQVTHSHVSSSSSYYGSVRSVGASSRGSQQDQSARRASSASASVASDNELADEVFGGAGCGVVFVSNPNASSNVLFASGISPSASVSEMQSSSQQSHSASHLHEICKSKNYH